MINKIFIKMYLTSKVPFVRVITNQSKPIRTVAVVRDRGPEQWGIAGCTSLKRVSL